MYAIEQTHVNHETGLQWSRILPKRYKTAHGAERMARKLRYIYKPKDRVLAVNDAKVIEVSEK